MAFDLDELLSSGTGNYDFEWLLTFLKGMIKPLAATTVVLMAFHFIFSQDHAVWIILAYIFMVSVAGYTAGQRAKHVPRGKLVAGASILAGTAVTMFLLEYVNKSIMRHLDSPLSCIYISFQMNDSNGETFKLIPSWYQSNPKSIFFAPSRRQGILFSVNKSSLHTPPQSYASPVTFIFQTQLFPPFPFPFLLPWLKRAANRFPHPLCCSPTLCHRTSAAFLLSLSAALFFQPPAHHDPFPCKTSHPHTPFLKLTRPSLRHFYLLPPL
uniref:Uncharacterized protein n=1 Tax=Populus alba TaxID=43335 RepID=A0A4U5N9P2_POPAL|nr:hypothetical protein D5086_0000270990 [Populus alba]